MGPLKGYRFIEMAGIGPGPFSGMLLSDMGAELIRVDRMVSDMPAENIHSDVMGRGRKSISVNLKTPEGIETVLKLISTADAIFEGYRPGVMEKLGLGPDVCLARKPELVYGRMTGWGQTGPLAHAAGHDINYISITGCLDAIGRKDSGPVPPLNMVGDFGGGSMYLVMGLLAALLEAKNSGKGQVVDVAITDGVISLMSCIYGFKEMGIWETGRGSNMLDGGAHYYDTYECSDGEWISIGSIEPQFFAMLMEKLGLEVSDSSFVDQFDKSKWSAYKEEFATIFKTKTSAEWCELMEGTDICFAPVLTVDNAPNHPHNKARQSFVSIDGVMQSSPAPRFSRTAGEIQGPPVVAGVNTDEILAELGLDAAGIADLKEKGAVN